MEETKSGNNKPQNIITAQKKEISIEIST